MAKGILASGHSETSRAGAEVLRSGGNAFDAALAALLAACVTEPLLVSLGGGGFLLARNRAGQYRVFDFFCQTPRQRCAAEDLDFYPILADFGVDQQEFHVGLGATAVPGIPAGVIEVHRQLGRMPLREIAQPAQELARKGVRVQALQAHIIRILEVILRSHPALLALFSSKSNPGDLMGEGETFCNGELADCIEQLSLEGEAPFYRGEWAVKLARDHRQMGGHLVAEDLASYRVENRDPLIFSHRDARCLVNPPPSPAGCLVAFASVIVQQLLEPKVRPGSAPHALALVRAMRATSLARVESGLVAEVNKWSAADFLESGQVSGWVDKIQSHSLFSRGTTHISVADRHGNLASLTASNGEGNAYVLPGSGIIMNNMLGEQDLNPLGFHRWRTDSRLSSMMCPTVVERADGSLVALGSGGSNRIRSAVVQVLVYLLHFGLDLEPAVTAPRLHLEDQKVSVEPGFEESAIKTLAKEVPELHSWPAPDLFFGGVHAVSLGPDGDLTGFGDPRRGGAVEIA